MAGLELPKFSQYIASSGIGIFGCSDSKGNVCFNSSHKTEGLLNYGEWWIKQHLLLL